MKKIFNAETSTGRANVAKATYGTIALLYIIHRLRKRGSAPNNAGKNGNGGDGEHCPCSDRSKTVHVENGEENYVKEKCSNYSKSYTPSADNMMQMSPNEKQIPTKIESNCCSPPTPSNCPSCGQSDTAPPFYQQAPSNNSCESSGKSSCESNLCLPPDTPLPPPTSEAVRFARVRAQEARIKAQCAIAEAVAARLEVEAIAKAESDTKSKSVVSKGGDSNTGTGGKLSCQQRREAARAAKRSAMTSKVAYPAIGAKLAFDDSDSTTTPFSDYHAKPTPVEIATKTKSTFGDTSKQNTRNEIKIHEMTLADNYSNDKNVSKRQLKNI